MEHVSNIFVKSSSDAYILSLKSFFERPLRIDAGLFNTTDTVSTFAAKTKVNPHGFINGFAIRSQKLNGFLGFRGTCVVKLVVNATRFQQGRYMLAYIPIGGAAYAQNGSAWAKAHMTHLITRTQLPHVEIDLNCDTEVELRIPYVSCSNYVPSASILSDANQSFAAGVVWIFPYSPLQAGSGSTTAGWTMWQHFEDVELIGPAIPQSGGITQTRKKKRNTSSAEQTNNNLGLISSPLTMMSQTLNALASVPGLSAYAGTASWVTDRLAGCARIFGWSKPSDISPPSRMYRALYPNLGTTDNVDTSLPLAWSSDHGVSQVEGFSGTNVDEMDFKNLFSIYSYFKQFTVATTDVAGTLVSSWDLNPNHYWYNITGTGGETLAILQPFNFITQYFQYWRGSLKFKIKFVKTEFHSGRIMVAFSPTTDAVSVANNTYDNTEYLHREIYDLRESSEVEFIVPFISHSPWKPTTGSGRNMGTIYVYVVDPLIAPSTVTQSIIGLIEVAAGPDFDLAVPITSANLVPYYNVTPQMGDVFSGKPNMCKESSSIIGGAELTPNLNNSAYCIGEKISSFRSILKNFSALASTGSTTDSNPFISILPYAWDYRWDAATIIKENWVPDMYGILNSIYAINRGGVRLKLPNLANRSTGLVNIQVGNISGNQTNMLTTSSSAARNGAPSLSTGVGTRVLALPEIGAYTEIAIPQYSLYHSRCSADHVCNTSQVYQLGGAGTATPISVELEFTSNTNPRAIPLRAGADDINFGCFVSIPPMIGTQGITRT